jgi:hypothetical protein
MRTTLELQDPLFARLKARAASERVTLKQLLHSDVGQGLSAAPERARLTRSAATARRPSKLTSSATPSCSSCSIHEHHRRPARSKCMAGVGLARTHPPVRLDVATARQLFRSLALLPMLGGSNAWKAAENVRQLRRKGITVRKTIDGIIATACIEANLPLLFSDRDVQPYVEHLGLELA